MSLILNKENKMNMLHSKCYQCGTAILVNQRAAKDPTAHICVHCSGVHSLDTSAWQQQAINNTSQDTDSEFEFDTLEEEELINPMIQWDVDMAADEYINSLNKKPKCECGAHAIKSNFHSDWCPISKEKE